MLGHARHALCTSRDQIVTGPPLDKCCAPVSSFAPRERDPCRRFGPLHLSPARAGRVRPRVHRALGHQAGLANPGPGAAAPAARPSSRANATVRGGPVSDPVPSHRLIDPRGHRFGAGLSAVILVAAFVAGLPVGGGARGACPRGERHLRDALLGARATLAVRQAAAASRAPARAGVSSTRPASPRPSGRSACRSR